jgi:hypothetical protein
VASKKKKKKRRGSKSKGGKGGISSMRGGIKSFVGQGPKKKESLGSKILTWVLFAAAVGVLIYRFLL